MQGQNMRRGLPRTPGGDPWPTTLKLAVQEAAVTPTTAPPLEKRPSVEKPPKVTSSSSIARPAAAAGTPSRQGAIRRGLPRISGGVPWPEIETQIVAEPHVPIEASSSTETPSATSPQASRPTDVARAKRTVQKSAAEVPTPVVAPAALEPKGDAPDERLALPVEGDSQATVGTVKPGRGEQKSRPNKVSRWVRVVMLWCVGAIAAAGVIVLAARGVTTLPGVPDFLERYPGEYALPAFVEEGFPAWARWTHFLNFFFMVLIVRTGLQVRRQQKPDAFYTPKRGGKKISIYLWLHTSLDVLWLLNGVVFVVLLFVTGHWARIVPTSWEVFPNAVSAALQYLTLEWPVEDGWVNYNSLQQLMYFLVVFVAAPIAVVTGIRMSEWWPQQSERLNRLYPAPLARALHYPTMLFFVLFVIVHVFLVFATGALRNLNHMFAGTPEVSWVGFWWFAAGLVVTVGAVAAAKPLLLAPIASLTGRVSNR